MNEKEMQARRAEAVVVLESRRNDRHDTESRDGVGWWKAKGCVDGEGSGRQSKVGVRSNSPGRDSCYGNEPGQGRTESGRA